jgi:hypothetical protein
MRRFVEYDHLLFAQQSLRETETLQVPLRELLYSLPAVLLEPEELDSRFHSRAALIGRNSSERRVSLQGFV